MCSTNVVLHPVLPQPRVHIHLQLLMVIHLWLSTYTAGVNSRVSALPKSTPGHCVRDIARLMSEPHEPRGGRECFQSYPLVLKHISPENPLSNSMFLLCICKCTYIIFINLIIYFYMHTHTCIYIYA